jgi:UDP-N-acetylmuramoyl-tripeptide--D-alanyl-D-alanine ligase
MVGKYRVREHLRAMVNKTGSFTLEEVLATTSGRVLQGAGPAQFSRVGTDSRSVVAGELFIALSGEHFDGHQFVAQALQNGALGAVISQPISFKIPHDKLLIQVGDTLQALQRLSAYHRSQFNIPLIAITGTAGKTTTKNLIAEVLKTKFNLLVTPGNMNNEFGVPLNLLSITPEHQAVVIELGMNHPGEVALLTSLAAPNIGVATNVGAGHIGFFGSVEEIAREKSALFSALPEEGCAILNYDDPRVRNFATQAHRVTYGLDWSAQIHPEKVTDKGLFGIEFILGGTAFHLPLPGIFNLYNALAALAVGYSLGFSWSQMAPALAQAQSEPQRNDINNICGVTVVNSAYNANPLSMESAIEWFCTLPTRGHRLLLLGDMLELGEKAEGAHRELGELVAKKWQEGKIFALVTVGDLGMLIAQSAWQAGMSRDLAIHEGREQAAKTLAQLLTAGDLLLVKASRRVRLEELIEQLSEQLGAKEKKGRA